MRETDFEGIPNTAAPHEGPLTVSNTAVSLASLATLHADTRVVEVGIEDAAVRLTINGTTPTATLGSTYPAGTVIRLSRQEADLAQFIRNTGTDAALQVRQYRG